MRESYGADLEVIEYGKPSQLTFDYAEKLMHERADELDVEISNFYMIGDNPRGDIKGPNMRGARWNSILVQTGIY